jgi:hypothetical protein
MIVARIGRDDICKVAENPDQICPTEGAAAAGRSFWPRIWAKKMSFAIKS